MMTNFYFNSLGTGFNPIWFWPFFLLLVVLSLFWKGLALWIAARRGEKIWFVVFLIVNTAGILEILYLYIFSKKAKPVES